MTQEEREEILQIYRALKQIENGSHALCVLLMKKLEEKKPEEKCSYCEMPITDPQEHLVCGGGQDARP